MFGCNWPRCASGNGPQMVMVVTMMVTLMVTMMVVMMLTHIDKILAAAITQSVKSEGAHKCQIDIGSLAPKMM